MAGGTFNKLVGKERPGTYVNKESTRQDMIKLSERGTVLIPLTMDWGPVNEFITISNSAVDGQYSKLGYSIYDDDKNGSMLMIREAFKLAQKVIIYRLSGGVKAACTAGVLTVTAMYPGTRGNDLKLVIDANPVAGFDVTIYLGSSIVFEQEGVTTVAELEASDWVVFSGSGNITATASTSLTGGTDTAKTNLDITNFLTAAEMEVWNTMAFPFDDASLQSALKTQIKYFRDDIGKKVEAVTPSYTANFEGIISVDNGVILSDGTALTKAQCCAWVAAADAAATNTESNTYLVYDDAVDINGKKTHDESVAAIKAGHLFFSLINGEVVIEYDINTLTDFDIPSSKDYRKNRVRRVLDTFDESIQLNFPPNKYDNSAVGWDLAESLGRQILTSYSEAGAIKDVDLDNDFLVDRESSVGDEMYVNIGLAPTDSAEKLYFTIKTR